MTKLEALKDSRSTDLSGLKEAVKQFRDRQWVILEMIDGDWLYAIWDTGYSVYGLGGTFIIPHGRADMFAIKRAFPFLTNNGTPIFAKEQEA